MILAALLACRSAPDRAISATLPLPDPEPEPAPACADGLPIVPFDPAAPTGTRRGDLAPDFVLETRAGTFPLSGRWTGCDQYGFLPDVDLSTSSDWPTLWERDLRPLLNHSPANVHWFFFPTSDPAALDALEAELDQALADRDDAEHWRERLHLVDTLEGWPAEKFATTGYGFLVGRDRRIRDVGSLANPTRYDYGVGWFENDISYAANEAVAADFAFAREVALAETGDRVVPVLASVDVTGAAEVLLDEDLSAADAVALDLTLRCPGDLEFGNCPAWDYLVYLQECGRPDEPDDAHAAEPCAPGDTLPCTCTEPDDQPAEHVRTCNAEGTGYGGCPCRCEELGRWITPYHREGRWVHDVSPLGFFLADAGPDRLVFSTSQTYTVDLSLRVGDRDGLGPPDVLTFLFGGGTFDDFYNDGRLPAVVEIPADVRKVALVAVVSGHGFGANADNCAEFCNHTHHFTVDGVEHVKEHPEAGSDEGCVDQVAIGTTPNQFGTWFYGRGGWCPGLEVAPWVVDVTAEVTPGSTATITYEGRLAGEPYVERPTSGTFDARIDLLSWLAIWRQ